MRLPASLRGLPRETFVLAVVAFCVALGLRHRGAGHPAVRAGVRGRADGRRGGGVGVRADALRVRARAAGGWSTGWGSGPRWSAASPSSAVSSLLAGLAVTYPQLLVLRGIGGVGSAVFTIASTSLLLRVAAAAQRGRTQSVYRAGFLHRRHRRPGARRRGRRRLAARAVLPVRRRRSCSPASPRRCCCPASPPARRSRSRRGVGRGRRRPGAARRRPASSARRCARRWRSRRTGRRSPATSRSASRCSGCAAPSCRCSSCRACTSTPSWTGAAFLVSALVQTVLLLPAGQAPSTRSAAGPRSSPAGCSPAFARRAGRWPPGRSRCCSAMAVFGAGASLLGVAPAALVGDVVSGKGGTAVAVWQMSSDLGSIVGPARRRPAHRPRVVRRGAGGQRASSSARRRAVRPDRRRGALIRPRAPARAS